MTTKQQVLILRERNPEMTKADIARSVKPPVTPQRVGIILNGAPDYRTDSYREYHRHLYHKLNVVKQKRKDCKYCQ